ncbi:unannotated protein [freshwater metagenome]|uniref:Unannotated protein n=1 Tax=freshwater metagenome TaxID=449393 RepID=A0A6J6NAB7_9ZZZZ
MADDFIKGGAKGLGVAPVAESRWVGAVIAEVLVADAVEFIGGNSWLDVGTNFN